MSGLIERTTQANTARNARIRSRVDDRRVRFAFEISKKIVDVRIEALEVPRRQGYVNFRLSRRAEQFQCSSLSLRRGRAKSARFFDRLDSRLIVDEFCPSESEEGDGGASRPYCRRPHGIAFSSQGESPCPVASCLLHILHSSEVRECPFERRVGIAASR